MCAGFFIELTCAGFFIEATWAGFFIDATCAGFFIEVMDLPASTAGALATLAFLVVFRALMRDFFWIDISRAPQNLNFLFYSPYALYLCRTRAKLPRLAKILAPVMKSSTYGNSWQASPFARDEKNKHWLKNHRPSVKS